MGYLQGKFNFPSDVEVSNNARDLMQRLVQLDAYRRLLGLLLMI